MLVYVKYVGQQLQSTGNVAHMDTHLKVAMSVVVQILCHAVLWLPIIVMTVFGDDVSPIIMVVVVTTIIPINSCLNPIILTLSSTEFQQTVLRFIRK